MRAGFKVQEFPAAEPQSDPDEGDAIG